MFAGRVLMRHIPYESLATVLRGLQPAHFCYWAGLSCSHSGNMWAPFSHRHHSVFRMPVTGARQNHVESHGCALLRNQKEFRRFFLRIYTLSLWLSGSGQGGREAPMALFGTWSPSSAARGPNGQRKPNFLCACEAPRSTASRRQGVKRTTCTHDLQHVLALGFIATASYL